MALYVLIAAERAKVLKEKVLTKAAQFCCRAPLLILMGKKSEKLPKEKTRARFQKYYGFVSSLPRRGRNTWHMQEKIWAGATR